MFFATANERLAAIRVYPELLRGELTPSSLVSRLKVASQLGVTEGTLAVIW